MGKLELVDEEGFTDFQGGEETKQQPSGLLSDEKVGLPRLIEALECSMWSNMVKKEITFEEPDLEITTVPQHDEPFICPDILLNGIIGATSHSKPP